MPQSHPDVSVPFDIKAAARAHMAVPSRSAIPVGTAVERIAVDGTDVGVLVGAIVGRKVGNTVGVSLGLREGPLDG